MDQFAALVSFIFLPGIIAAIIVDKISARATPWDAFKFSIYSFVFGYLCYFVLQAISWILGVLPRTQRIFSNLRGELDVWKLSTSGADGFDIVEVASAVMIAPLVALIVGWAYNQKIINRVAQRLGVSRKYGDENLFTYFLNSQEVNWVYIRDHEKRLSYRGKIISFAEKEHLQEIVLHDVAVFAYDKRKPLYSIKSIYLSREAGKLEIETPWKETSD